MDLELNNPWRLIYHSTKKPNLSKDRPRNNCFYLSNFFFYFFTLFSQSVIIAVSDAGSEFISCPEYEIKLHLIVIIITLVTYWPSTEPSIKRCTNVNKRKNSGITRCPRRFEPDGVSWGPDAEVRASGRLRALGPQWPTVEQPQPRWERSAAMVRRTWVNMHQSVPVSSSPLTHNQHQPFRE